MNIAKMMKQAQKMQADALRVQKELASAEFEAVAGGGAVKAIATGDGQLKGITIDPEVLKEGDAEMLQDLVLTAVTEAINKGREEAASQMGKITGGMNIPGLG